jgi:hypothetical protein
MAAADATIVPPSGLTASALCGTGAGAGTGAGSGCEPRVAAMAEVAEPVTGAGAGTGPGTGAGAAGGATAPGDGGATPIMVAFMTGFPAEPGLGPTAAGAAGAAGGFALGEAAGAAPGRGIVGGALTMSMVPLNFGAAAPFRLKPHFWHAVALSSFCVPQFGQNTLRTSGGARRTRLGHGGGYTRFVHNLKSAGHLNLGHNGSTRPGCGPLGLGRPSGPEPTCRHLAGRHRPRNASDPFNAVT